MMMHKDMQDTSGHQSEIPKKQAPVKVVEKNTSDIPQKKSPREHSESKKKSKALFIIGGIGMGLMMALMIL